MSKTKHYHCQDITVFWASELKNIYRSKSEEIVYFRNTRDFRAHPAVSLHLTNTSKCWKFTWFVCGYNNETMNNIPAHLILFTEICCSWPCIWKYYLTWGACLNSNLPFIFFFSVTCTVVKRGVDGLFCHHWWIHVRRELSSCFGVHGLLIMYPTLNTLILGVIFSK